MNGRKRFRMVVLLLLILTLLVPMEIANADAAALKSRLESVYNSALKSYVADNKNSVSTFNGYCGSCTGYQLRAAGVFGSIQSANGNQSYDLYKRLSSGKYSTKVFPGTYKGGSYTIRDVLNALNQSNPNGENTYTVFSFKTGSGSDAGQKYGHVLLVHAVYNGYVYWGESFMYNNAYTHVDTIDKFVSIYKENGKTYHFDGANAYGYYERTTDTLTLDGIRYPSTYVISTSGYAWPDNTCGVIRSDTTITKLTINLYDSTGAKISYTPTDNSNFQGKQVIAMKDIGPNIKVSKITKTGTSYFEIIAEDAKGRRVSQKVPFEAVSSGSTVTTTFTATADSGSQPQPVANTIRFVDVVYPKQYKIGASGGYKLTGGTVQSDTPLASITSRILKSDGTVLSDSGKKTISGTSYAIKNLDTYSSSDNGVKFSYVKTAGSYVWLLIATDTAGNTKELRMPFEAGAFSATTTATMSSDSHNGTLFTDPDFVLPSALTTIESCAFKGISAKKVYICSGVTSIGSRAFADCKSMECIYIPASVTGVAADAFSGTTMTVYCHEGSFAHSMAQSWGMNYVIVP